MGKPADIEILVERVRASLGRQTTVKRMFGGFTFMLNGNMLCCASSKGLMVRVGADAEADALMKPFVGRCLGAGRPMAGFLLVAPEGILRDVDLQDWLTLAVDYVGALPPKPAGRRQITRKVRRSNQGERR